MDYIKIYKEEGHYIIRQVTRLPKRGNHKELYTLLGDTLSVLYKYNTDGTYTPIRVGQEKTKEIKEIETADALNSTQAIALANEIKAKVNEMIKAFKKVNIIG